MPQGHCCLGAGTDFASQHYGARKRWWQLPETWFDDLARKLIKVGGPFPEKLATMIQAIVGAKYLEELLQIMSQ